MGMCVTGWTLWRTMDHNRSGGHDVSTFHWTPIARVAVFHLEVATEVVLQKESNRNGLNRVPKTNINNTKY